MSLVHRLIVGHFDIDTFVSRRPVTLRSLDAARTRAMLEEVGKRTNDDEYNVDGEPLYFVDGNCDCPWKSYKHNQKSEQFARAVATIEDCFLIETGVGTIRHPVRSVQAASSWHRWPESGLLAPLSRAEAEAITQEGDATALLCHAAVRAAVSEGDWVEDFCAGLVRNGDFHVRGIALFAARETGVEEDPAGSREDSADHRGSVGRSSPLRLGPGDVRGRGGRVGLEVGDPRVRQWQPGDGGHDVFERLGEVPKLRLTVRDV